MFNVGVGELIFILVAALLILGPQRLPEFARTIGRFLREFRRQTDEVRGVVEREFYRMDQDLGREEPRPKLPPPIPAAMPPFAPSPLAGAEPAGPPEPAPPEGTLPSVGPPEGVRPAVMHAVPASPAGGGAAAEEPPRPEPVPGTTARDDAPKPG